MSSNEELKSLICRKLEERNEAIEFVKNSLKLCTDEEKQKWQIIRRLPFDKLQGNIIIINIFH